MIIEQRWPLGVHRRKHLCAVALLSMISRPVSAEPSANAREHFASGVRFAERGEVDAAASEFEAAYRISPNFAVLYNLGEAYLTLGRQPDAVKALRSYLLLGAEKIPAARRQEVEARIFETIGKLGTVKLTIEPADSELFVDGHEQDPATTVLLAPGEHVVAMKAPRFLSFVGRISVAAGQTQNLRLQLEAEPPVATERAVGQLTVSSQLPAVRISLDGEVRLLTGAEPLVVTVGHHELVCARDGYATETQDLEIAPNRLAHATCELRPLADLSGDRVGFISLLIQPSDAEVHIDGRLAGTVARLPAGEHDLSVRRTGYEDWSERIAVRAGVSKRVSARLRPTAQTAERQRNEALRRRTWSYLFGGVGAALVGTGVGLYVENSSRYDAWKRESDVTSSALAERQWSPTLKQRVSDLQSQASSVQKRDDDAFGVASAGVAFIAYALISLVTSYRE